MEKNVLNDVQAREYNRAQALNLCLTEESKTVVLYPPFNNEAQAFFLNNQKLINLVPSKNSNGTILTEDKSDLKTTIATNANIICTRTAAYAVKIEDKDLLEAVYSSISTIRGRKDADVLSFVTRLTDIVSPLLSKADFLPYAVTEDMLTSLTADATDFNNSIGKASFADSKSSYASEAIDTVLKAIRNNVVQFDWLLNFFTEKYPEFVKSYRTASAIDYSNIHHSGIKGVIKNSNTGIMVKGASVILAGKKNTKSTTTDDDGFWEIKKFRSGKCRLTVSAAGYETQAIEVIIIRGKTLELNISLQSAIIEFNKTA